VDTTRVRVLARCIHINIFGRVEKCQRSLEEIFPPDFRRLLINETREREREREREARFNNINPSFPLDRCRTVSRRDNLPYRGIIFSITAGLFHRWVTRNLA